MSGNSAPTPNGAEPDPFTDPFADLVLDEAFIAGATRYEAPARTRAAVARFGPLEDGSTPWRSYGGGRPRRAGGASGPLLGRGRASQPIPEISPRPRSRGRIVLALISVVLLSTTVYGFVASAVDSPPSTTLSADPPTPAGSASGRDAIAEESLPDLYRRDWTAGHCYTWLQRDVSTAVNDVPCAGPHLFEAVGPLDVGSAYPEGATYPSPAEWVVLGRRQCEPLITAYLGYGLDPFGRFGTSVLHPKEAEWDTGERDIVCGLSLHPSPTAPYEVPDLEGQVRGADQALTYPTGTCFRTNAEGRNEVVPCEQSHHSQSVGTATLADTAEGAPNSAPLSAERLDELIDAACAPRIAPYLDRGFGGASVQGGSHSLPPASRWVGTRSTTCTVSLVDRNGRKLETTGLLSPDDDSGSFKANV
ncbi:MULTISPECIES: septum formation family protein [unclassified Parafrankia]|uniref:septum formation family protein n=1 Tax=unclassified Parafrankia TaxID=2994368 RepID=UPI000DA4434A|nr:MULTISPECIES: septum formation family protein [unclassified Parafrankia]TCJ34113.1 hypothetical protein E0504_33045 [Parafrankia sp. BMG5.11]SQD94051.1 conserved hypothetical protein [Parafrankia sp. Ea1.12]